jgi:hypothetical protein
MSSTLEDLTSRLGQLAEASDGEDDALLELREVERQLQTCCRRLAKIARDARR